MKSLTREEIREQNEKYKKVYFIGSGYEAVMTVTVEASTAGEAIDKAEELYKAEGWDFHYCEIEVARCL